MVYGCGYDIQQYLILCGYLRILEHQDEELES